MLGDTGRPSCEVRTMNAKRIAVIVLVAASIALGLHYALTQYGGNIERGIGYALAPWIFGAIVAGIKALVQRLRGKPHDFVNSMTWAAGVIIVLLTVGAFMRG